MPSNIPRKIEKFLVDFSKKFGQYLLLDPKIIKRGEAGEHIYRMEFFDIYSGAKGNTKFSDWDIHCKLKNKKLDISILQDMLIFIKGEAGFSEVGVILSANDKFKKLACHKNKKGIRTLQFMAFMKNETESPFVDININGISGSRRGEMAAFVSDEEFICWAFLTYWRKRLKMTDTDNSMAKSILDIIIFSLFPGFKALDDTGLITTMKKYLIENNYHDEVKFLNQG